MGPLPTVTHSRPTLHEDDSQCHKLARGAPERSLTFLLSTWTQKAMKSDFFLLFKIKLPGFYRPFLCFSFLLRRCLGETLSTTSPMSASSFTMTLSMVPSYRLSWEASYSSPPARTSNNRYEKSSGLTGRTGENIFKILSI